LIDPHTAIGTKAARVCHGDGQAAMITLATAHPAKFPAAIAASGIGIEAQLPHHLADLFEREEAFDVLPNDLAAVQAFLAGNCRA
jgi:threonine synthase